MFIRTGTQTAVNLSRFRLILLKGDKIEARNHRLNGPVYVVYEGEDAASVYDDLMLKIQAING